MSDAFTDDERAVLARHFTNVDAPVFALTDLPEVVKGALFARYSRSAKSLRRVFLDEFVQDATAAGPLASRDTGLVRAEELYERVLTEYGDDSVAQLAGAHVAVEGASNILTKILERGRLMAYLEQSTRYVPYNDRPDGRWRYHVPAELDGSPARPAFVSACDAAFETYSRWFEPLQDYLRGRFPRDPNDSAFAYRMSIRAKACDILRGLLPAATTSNVGLYGSGQAFEALLLRLQAHSLREAQDTGRRLLLELRKVIPAFLRRVDQSDRGVAWSDYLAATREALEREASALRGAAFPAEPGVVLTDWDPDGELKVIAAALYPEAGLPDAEILAHVRRLGPPDRDRILAAAVGERRNRRHRPGRAFERTSYRFDVVSDYGAFRDLQRHRMLTIDWQPLSPDLGYDLPAAAADAGLENEWRETMDRSAQAYAACSAAGLPTVAAYAVAMAHRIRYAMQMNAREAMHIIELRTSPQGHPAYRAVARRMRRLIDEVAGHHAIAAAMTFVGEGDVDLERLDAERRMEARRRALPSLSPRLDAR